MAETNNLLLAYAIIKLWGDVMNTLNYKIDEDVKLIRELLNLFQEQFAWKIGIDPITVVKWETIYILNFNIESFLNDFLLGFPSTLYILLFLIS